MFGLIYIDYLKLPITFLALEENSTVKIYVKEGTPNIDNLYFKRNKDFNWTKYNINDIIILENIGDTISFKNNNYTFSSQSSYLSFDLTGQIEVFGNILSLSNYKENTIWQFAFSFMNCTGLVNASKLLLPTINVKTTFYYNMFNNCINLKYPPQILPGKTIGQSSYCYMFKGCKSLIKTPEIHLTEEFSGANYGCLEMFNGCTSLKYGPSILLPKNISNVTSMYASMFYNCQSLLYAPIINTITIDNNSIYGMFYNCKLIDKIEVNFTEWSENPSSWVRGVSPSGTFICPKELPEIRGINNIPENWEIIRK